MSSGSEHLRLSRAVCSLIAGGCFAVSACGAIGQDQPAVSAVAALETSTVQTPVGPVPGPAQPAPEPHNPYRGRRGAMAEGREMFVRFNCSGCHGGRAGGGMGPSLRDVDWIYGRTDLQVFSSIAEGRAHGMPAWGARLTEDQVWKLVTYVESLRTPEEPDAP